MNHLAITRSNFMNMLGSLLFVVTKRNQTAKYAKNAQRRLRRKNEVVDDLDDGTRLHPYLKLNLLPLGSLR